MQVDNTAIESRESTHLAGMPKTPWPTWTPGLLEQLRRFGVAIPAIERGGHTVSQRVARRLKIVLDGHGGVKSLEVGQPIAYDALHALDGCVRIAPELKQTLLSGHPPADASLAQLRAHFAIDAGEQVDDYVSWEAFAGFHAALFGEDPPPAAAAEEATTEAAADAALWENPVRRERPLGDLSGDCSGRGLLRRVAGFSDGQ